MAKVIVLFSGSLASRVTAALVQRHPEVESIQLLHFRSPFAAENEVLRELVRGEWSGTPLRTQSLKREYRRFVDTHGDEFSIQHCCTQCRALLFGRSVRYMERTGADYLATGERAGRNGLGAEEMRRLAEKYGVAGRVLRPLCQRRSAGVPPLAEWSCLDRTACDHPMTDADVAEAAVRLGLSPENPLGSCGRCKLTVPGFGERVANLFREEGFTLNALRLLDFTFYYKIEPGAKVVVAVDEEEKRELQNLFLPEDLRVYPATPHGPMALVRADWAHRSDDERVRIIDLASCIVATHASAGRSSSLPVYYRLESDDETLLVNARALETSDELDAIPGVLGMALRDAAPAAA